MLKKLPEYEITNRDGAFINADCNTKIINTLVRKINELVDAVNGILDYAPLEMAMKAEPKTPAENVQSDYVITYMSDGHIKKFYGHDSIVELEVPLPQGTRITIREPETKGGNNE